MGTLWSEFIHLYFQVRVQIYLEHHEQLGPAKFSQLAQLSHNAEGAAIHSVAWRAIQASNASAPRQAAAFALQMCLANDYTKFRMHCFHGVGHGILSLLHSGKTLSYVSRYSASVPLGVVRKAESFCSGLNSRWSILCVGGLYHQLFKVSSAYMYHWLSKDWAWPCNNVTYSRQCYFSLFSGQIALLRWQQLGSKPAAFPSGLSCWTEACVTEISRYTFASFEAASLRAHGEIPHCVRFHGQLPLDIPVLSSDNVFTHGLMGAWCMSMHMKPCDTQWRACIDGAIRSLSQPMAYSPSMTDAATARVLKRYAQETRAVEKAWGNCHADTRAIFSITSDYTHLRELASKVNVWQPNDYAPKY
jgi:hypothetical protein